MDKKIIIYSLTTSYAGSLTSNTHFVHVLNKELILLGIQVKTITPHSTGQKTTEVIDGVNVHRFKYLPEKYEINSSSISDEVSKSQKGIFKIIFLTLGFFIFTFFKCLKEKPDIIHANWAFPGGYVAYVMSKIFRTKGMVTVHGGEIPLLRKFNFLRKIVVHGLNNLSIIIANSNFTKNELISIGVNEKKIIVEKVIPNFLKHSKSKESLTDFRSKFTNTDNKIILYLGRLVERKGVEYLIRALDEMKTMNVHLIIVGGGELFEKLQLLSKQLNLLNKVTFFGRATDDELDQILKISDIFVCPSIIDSRGMTEYLGLVIPEAMESGLPVIASSVGGIVDTIQNEVNGLLVEQKNPKAIANAMERILSDEELKKKIIENSKETVKEFSPNVIGKKYYEIYQNCLN